MLLNQKRIREIGIAVLRDRTGMPYRTIQALLDRDPYKMQVGTALRLAKHGLPVEDWFRDENGKSVVSWINDSDQA